MGAKQRKECVIALDFDGTLVKHVYPEIGESIGAMPWCRVLTKLGARLILLTMRSDNDPPKKRSKGSQEAIVSPRPVLTEAVEWCRGWGVEFWGVNENPGQKYWNGSRKVSAEVYVDDAAMGCPLIGPLEFGESDRPWVDWSVAGPWLVNYAKVRLQVEDDVVTLAMESAAQVPQ